MNQKHVQDKELGDLEAHLAGTLRPVQPSQELIHRLRARIRMPQREQIVLRLQEWRSLVMALGGVLSGALLIMTVARALYHLVGRRG